MTTKKTATKKPKSDPTTSEKRGRFVRFSVEDWAEFEAKAKKDDRRLNDWIRLQCKRAP